MSDQPKGEMGIWMTSALVVGTIIGSGIFMLPVSLATLGRNALIGWLISGVGVLCIAYALGQLSKFGGGWHSSQHRARIRTDRGIPRRMVVLGFKLDCPGLRRSGGCIGFVLHRPSVRQSGDDCSAGDRQRARYHLDQRDGRSRIRAFFDCHCSDQGPSAARRRLVVCTAQGERRRDGAPPPTPLNFANIAAATALTFFAFTGFESATAPVGKVRNASRTIPLALLGGTAFVVMLYLVAGTGIQALLPASDVLRRPHHSPTCWLPTGDMARRRSRHLASRSLRSAASMVLS